MKTENKNSWFIINAFLDEPRQQTETYKENLKDSIDLILGSMNTIGEPNIFSRKDNTRLVYIFRTNNRKRKGQLVKFCERFLPDKQIFEAQGLTRTQYTFYLNKFRTEEHIYTPETNEEDIKLDNYEGDDLDVFKNIKN